MNTSQGDPKDVKGLKRIRKNAEPAEKTASTLEVARNMLKESEKTFHLLIESTSEWIWAIDREGRHIYSSPSVEKILGYRPEELEGKESRLSVHEDDRALVDSMLPKCIGTKSGWSGLVLRRRHKNGEFRYLESNALPILDERGKLVGFEGADRDITERKRAEERLSASESNYRQLVENAYVSLFRQSAEGKIIFMSQALVRLFEFSSLEELKSRNARDLYKEKARSDELIGLLRERGKVENFEAEVVTRSGSVRQILMNAWMDGDIVSGMMTDMTEQKRLETALRESEEQFRNLAEKTPNMIFINQNGRVVYVNEKCSEEMGYTKEEFLSSQFDFRKLIAPESLQLANENFAAHEKGIEVPPYEYALLTKDGKKIDAIHTTRLMTFGGRRAILGIITDITDRKRIEESLRQSELKYRTIFENVQDVFYQTDRNGCILDISPSIHRYAGFTREELIGRPVLDVYAYPEDQRMLVRELYRKGEVIDHVLRLKSKTGQMIYVSANAHLLHDSKGQPCGAEGVLRDVTPRRLAEEALRRSEENYRNIIDFAPVGIYQSSLEGEFITANMALARMLGYGSVEELVTKNIAEDVYLHNEDRNEVTRKFEAEGHLPDLVMRWKRKDGAPIWVQLDGHAVKGESGETKYFEGFVRDFTGRKRADETNTLLAQTLKSAQDCISITDLSDKILFVNNAFLATYGYSENDLIGKNIAMVRSPSFSPLRAAGILPATLKGNWHGELMNRRRDGTEFPIELWTSPVYDGEGKPIAAVGVAREITERKRTEEALRESEERYRQLVDLSPDAFVVHTGGRFTYANPAAIRLFGGQELKDILGKPIIDFVHPQYRDVVQQRVQEIHKGRPAPLLEEKFIQLDGTVIDVEVAAMPFSFGGERSVQVVIRDITDRKKAENQRLASEKRFRSVWDHSADGMRLTDGEGWIVEVNEAYCKLVNIPREKLLGHLFSIAYERGGLDDDLSLYQQRFRTGGIEPHSSATATLWDGRSIDFEISSSFMDMNGEGKLLLCIFRDLTERRKAEEKIAEQARLLDVALDAILVRDMNDTLLYMNRAAQEMYGRTFDDVRSLDVRKTISADSWEKFKEAKEIFLQKGTWEGELRQVTAQGQTIVTESRWTLIHDKEGKPSARLIINRDVTKQKQLEEELTQIQKMESIGTLAAGIAHDFNNILGIILGYSSLIEHIADKPEKLSQSVQAINAAVQRGASLVKQILTFARKTEMLFGPIDVNVMIREIVKMLQETIPKTIEFSLELHRDIPLINADATQLHQAILNIAVNARDAMPTGGTITFKTRVAHGPALRDVFVEASDIDYVCVSVGDTGVGMSPAIRSHIFDPFFTTKEKGKGTGLGLSVVYGVMKNHNGFINVQSEPAHGSTFDLYFPIPVQDKPSGRKQPEVRGEIRGGSETILLVEDEGALLVMTKAILEAKGYRLLTAADGFEALELYRTRMDEIALVLTDVGLPKLSGDRLFFELKRLNPSVRVILASGYIEPEVKSEIFKAGAKNFIQKPYDADDLLSKVRDTIDG